MRGPSETKFPISEISFSKQCNEIIHSEERSPGCYDRYSRTCWVCISDITSRMSWSAEMRTGSRVITSSTMVVSGLFVLLLLSWRCHDQLECRTFCGSFQQKRQCLSSASLCDRPSGKYYSRALGKTLVETSSTSVSLIAPRALVCPGR